MQPLSTEQYGQIKKWVDVDRGAPKSERAILGTYAQDPEKFMTNFAKYYKDDEVADLSNVAGFNPGDLLIPIRDSKEGEPAWTVYNPTGIDVGDFAANADAIANITGYLAGRAAVQGPATVFGGGPVGTMASMAIGETAGNVAGQAAEAGWDASVRALADPPHGELEDYTAAEVAEQRGKGFVSDTLISAGLWGIGKTGQKVKDAFKWAGRKVVEAGGDSSKLQNIRETRKRLEYPTLQNKTPEQIGEALGSLDTKIADTWSQPVPIDTPLSVDQQSTVNWVASTMKMRADDAQQWLNDIATNPSDRSDKLARLMAAEELMFPINIPAPTISSITDNRLLTQAESWAALFPGGRGRLEKNYAQMVDDINVSVQDIARSWLHGKPYRGSMTERTAELVDADGNVINASDAILDMGEVQDAMEGTLRPRPGVGGAPGTPSYMQDVYYQRLADMDAGKAPPTQEFQDVFGPGDTFREPRLADNTRPVEALGFDRSFEYPSPKDILSGTEIASADSIGRMARQGLEIGHNQTMARFKDAFGQFDMSSIPVVTNTSAIANGIKADLTRVAPSGDDIYGKALGRAARGAEGLQPDWGIARQWIEDKVGTGDQYIDDLYNRLRSAQRDGTDDPEGLVNEFRELAEGYGFRGQKVAEKFDATVPTIKDMVREYRRIGQDVGMNTDPDFPTEKLLEVRAAMRNDILDSIRATEGDEAAAIWDRVNTQRELYDTETYYPMVKDIMTNRSDVEAYNLLMKGSDEGVADINRLMDQMPHEHQNAIRAATWLRLGKENPQNYDFKDFDLMKFADQWNSMSSAKKDAMFNTPASPLRDSMDNLAGQINNLKGIEERITKGKVGEIVSATIVYGGITSAILGIAGLSGVTGDYATVAIGTAGAGAGIIGSTVGGAYAVSRLLTNKRAIDSLTRLVGSAPNDPGKLKQFFRPVDGAFRLGLDRFLAIADEEGVYDGAELLVNAIGDAMMGTADAAEAMGWNKDRSDLSQPENIQYMMEGLTPEQSMELRTGMTPESIKTMQDIYTEAMGAP